MNRRKLIFLLVGLPFLGIAQFTAIHTEINEEFKKGLTFYNDGLFHQSYHAFKDYTKKPKRIDEATFRNLKLQAEMLKGQSAIQNDQKEGEVIMTDFVRNNRPDPLAYQAAITVADKYFDSNDFNEALAFYDLIDIYNLSESERNEVIFKKGYAHFVQKDFNQAMGAFNIIKDSEGRYYYPANYYLGMSHYFMEDYEQAERRLKMVENSNSYRPYIPYYVAQILFVQDKYEELVQYGESRLENRGIRKTAEIKQLVGRAFFEMKQYEKALYYLEQYASRNSKMAPEDFYQLGFLNYKQEQYNKAADYLKQLLTLETPLGQASQYMLGNSYLAAGRKEDALIAFQRASSLDFDKELKDEALWNYAKLSYETGAPGLISILQEIEPKHPRFNEAQELMSYVLLNSRDIDKALEIVESIPNRTPQLNRTYQEILYYKGIDAQRKGDRDLASVYLDRSMQIQMDPEINALATYWKADLEYESGQKDKAKYGYNRFLQLTGGMRQWPDEANPGMAHYNLGYIELGDQQYSRALNHFQQAINYIASQKVENEYISRNVAGDVVLRIGDCHFANNNYGEAVRAYDNVIANKFAGFDYALYQKAQILGLQGKEIEKILALESIADKYPESDYSDDALFLAGKTYNEIGRQQEAIKMLEKMIKNFPDSYLLNQAYMQMGLISINLGVSQAAIENYKKVLQNNPTQEESEIVLNNMEEIYVNIGRSEEFIQYKKQLGLKVESFEQENLAFRTAKTRFDSKKYAEAIGSCSYYLENYGNGRYALEVLFYRAESNGALENWAAAMADFEKIIRKGRSAYYSKALEKSAYIAYNQLKDMPKAFQMYQRLAEDGENEQSKFEGLVGVLRTGYQLKNNAAVEKAAKAMLNNAIAAPEDKAQAYYYLGKYAYERGDITTAIRNFNASIKNNNNAAETAEARYLIAKIHYDKGELDMAEALAKAAAQQNANHQDWQARSVILMADIYYDQKDYFKSSSFLKEIKKMYKGNNQSVINEIASKLDRAEKALETNSELLSPAVNVNRVEMEEHQ